MFTAMRRVAVAAVVLTGSVFFAGSAHATFKLDINGPTVASASGSGTINYSNNFGNFTIAVFAQSYSPSASQTMMQTFNISFQNNTMVNQTVTIALYEDNAVGGLAPSTVTGTFSGSGSLSSSSLLGLAGSVKNTATIKGVSNPALKQTIFNSPFNFYYLNPPVAGNFSATYTGQAPMLMKNYLVVTVPMQSGFTYSGSLSFSAPEPATIVMLISGVPVLGAIGWMRRRRKTATA